MAIHDAAPGAPVSLSIRPERINLNVAQEQNRFSGRVREFIYLGDHVRIRMEACGNSSFIVKQPIATLDPKLAVGDVISLGWNVEHTALAGDLTVISFGGANKAAQEKAYYAPFTKATGIKVVGGEYNGEMAKVKAMVDTKSVSWDVLEVESPELARGCDEGIPAA
uniref:Transport-associated OB type 2 domain-containing protein n=1 Tax=Anopheles coluzzii TaxID=1518534 RepID=A0A8W7P704_ANOCL